MDLWLDKKLGADFRVIIKGKREVLPEAIIGSAKEENKRNEK